MMFLKNLLDDVEFCINYIDKIFNWQVKKILFLYFNFIPNFCGDFNVY